MKTPPDGHLVSRHSRPALGVAARATLCVAVAPGAWTVWRLSSAGRRIEPVPSSFDPASGTLSFVARTDYDPASATLCYELARD